MRERGEAEVGEGGGGIAPVWFNDNVVVGVCEGVWVPVGIDGVFGSTEEMANNSECAVMLNLGELTDPIKLPKLKYSISLVDWWAPTKRVTQSVGVMLQDQKFAPFSPCRTATFAVKLDPSPEGLAQLGPINMDTFSETGKFVVPFIKKISLTVWSPMGSMVM